MKAVVLTEHADHYEVLQTREVERPQIGARDVLIEVHAAGFNPFDCKLRKGWLRRFYPFPLPHVLGNDVAGVVVEKGPAVFEFNVGDRVYGLQATMRWGASSADTPRRSSVSPSARTAPTSPPGVATSPRRFGTV